MDNVEDFNMKYEYFFLEPLHTKRWKSLLKMFNKDFGSFRVLFTIETLGLVERWQKPSNETLQKMLRHRIQEERFGVHLGNITKLIEPVWPLELAKVEVALFKTFAEMFKAKEYILTYMKLWSTALLQTWWALETLMNDLSGIILNQRRSSLSQIEHMLLNEQSVLLDDKGQIAMKPTYQPIEQRLLFIYETLTGQSIDKGASRWQAIKKLKDSRDNYVHRIGKSLTPQFRFLDKKVLSDGLRAVRELISDIFRETPEFRERFIYEYLAFWSCKTEVPFLWDSRNEVNFYLGLMRLDGKRIRSLFASEMPTFVNIVEGDD